MNVHRTFHMTVVFPCIFLACSGPNSKTIEASGIIEGTEVNVGTEVGGRVLEVRVEEGNQVKKGDTLLIVSDEDYRLQLRQARANLAASEAQYKLALEGARREDLLQAEANFKTAQADYHRMKELLASNTVTQKQFDDAETRYIIAQQTYEKLKRGLRSNEIAVAGAKVDHASAQVDQLMKKVNDCYILSPAEGVVTLKAIEPGELVTPGSNLIRITYLEKVKLMIYLSEIDIGKISLGQRAHISIDSHPDRTFDGKVVFISPVAEFTPKNVQTKEERTKLVFGVRIEVDNREGVLKPGLPADAALSVE